MRDIDIAWYKYWWSCIFMNTIESYQQCHLCITSIDEDTLLSLFLFLFVCVSNIREVSSIILSFSMLYNIENVSNRTEKNKVWDSYRICIVNLIGSYLLYEMSLTPLADIFVSLHTTAFMRTWRSVVYFSLCRSMISFLLFFAFFQCRFSSILLLASIFSSLCFVQN